ncbi:CpsD/CapB family tyrosine-protein kinase [bacterium]|nr:CpsD/CapB family tyrosine-protein kinase [bacterium]
MTKIFEALEQASQERSLQQEQRQARALTLPARLEVSKSTLEETMVGLYQNITAMLPMDSGKVIQFIGSKPGEGTSVLAREFARVASLKLGKRVLLVDADPHRPVQSGFFGIRPDMDWRQVIREGREIDQALYQVETSNLYITQFSSNNVAAPPVFDAPQLGDLFGELRSEFDLVILDTPPGTKSSDGLALSPKTDGVVLVVEAEKTRWQVAEHVVRRIEKQGGKVLGVVLNKRRFPVPEFIYRRF